LPRIFGCTVDPSWLDNGLLLGWQTCDPLGYTGWVNYEWDAPTRFKATHLSLAWMSQSGGWCGYNDGHIWDGYGNDCRIETVTPEPATWALMTTGLVGIALARRLRKRR
jgi:hypothetical protein